jgi:hypothetical protein
MNRSIRFWCACPCLASLFGGMGSCALYVLFVKSLFLLAKKKLTSIEVANGVHERREECGELLFEV